jgi:sulfopropanediol 3-dehydrogenase
MDRIGSARLVPGSGIFYCSRMRYSKRLLESLSGSYQHLKTPGVDAPAAQRDPAVIETVSSMLLDIDRRGIDAVRDYAKKLDRQDRTDFELDAATIAASGSRLPADLREAIELGSERTRAFARAQRAKLVDLEIELVPGLVTGARYIPVGRVGAYLPAGRFPLTASAFMTVGVAKEAGVPTVIACSPPQPNGAANDAVVYAAHLSGVDRVFVLGGVQALAAMAYGLLGEAPVDMLVGAGNAFVAEAKRQLFGTVSIDLLAGPSEVAVISDETADPELVAADLLGQAEHGPNSPAALITTSEEHGRAVMAAVERQLETLATESIAGPAWRDYGVVTVAKDRETAATLMDDLAPEHLEVITADDGWYHDRLRNYGSIFLGPWSTVAYSDKGMAGTNHVLPTAGGAKHSAGLSVSRFLKPLTYQRIARETTPELAHAVQVISDSEGMAAHSATATLRLDRL